jgi:hypothetical protein
MHDCCGFCPKPTTPEEEEVAAEESKIYISGDVSFLSDNPGRQEIGSFNPITETDWTGECLYNPHVSRLTIDRNGLRGKHCRIVSGNRRQ